MGKLFGLNKPNTNLKKNVFDLSEKTLFSLSAGMLLPCLSRELNPGEKVKFNLSSFTRTQPLNSSAFVRCRQYYHVFFVPYKQLWSGWDNFINGVDYKTSALQAGKDYSQVPGIPLFDFIEKMIKDGTLLQEVNLVSQTKPKVALDEHGFDYFRGISRLLDLLGYGFQMRVTDEQKSEYSSAFLPYKNLKSLSEFFDVFATEYFRAIGRNIKSGIPISPNEEAGATLGNTTYWADSVFDRVNNMASDLIEAAAPGTEAKNLFLKALDHYFPSLREVRVNPFRLLAYQKIYSDFYKRDDYEATHPEHFNIDDFAGASVDVSDTDRMLGMLRLRYRWLPKDYFTGIVPSELFGTTTAFDLDISDKLVGNSNAFSPTGDSVVLEEGNSNISTKSIRAAFAIEKMLRLTRRAGGQDYISQISAHYGFEPPKGRGDKVDFLGGYATNININDVITTADTLYGDTGQVRGQGIGASSDNKPIEFTAKEHGVLMCITSVVPETDYESTGLDPFNVKFKRGDYFHPEFQDLGLQPIFGHELCNDLNPAVEKGRNSILGYVPRYAEYKIAYDKLHGDFRGGRSLSSWASISSLAYDYKGKGTLINTLKVNPRVLDSIMVVAFDGREVNDQFYSQVHFDVKVIRPMSITGQKL